jgi:3-oxoacyl-[acyl-carrier protein] reductase
MDLSFEGKVVFITGGTGDIGRELVKTFVEEGAYVLFTYSRSDAKARSLLEEVNGAGPHDGGDPDGGRRGGDPFGAEARAKGVKVSVLDSKGLEATARELFEAKGRIDVLVNNAGVAQVLPFPLIEEEEWDELMDTNVKGVFLATKAVSRFMIKRKSGSIVNLGSIAGERIMEVPVHYAASKAAVRGLTLSLAKELSRYNIRVNCVVPGLIDGGVSRNTPEKQKNQYIEFCAMKRMGTPREVANLVVFIASERSAYIDGQILSIDGGI